ncbi:ATP-binding protein [uncultured Croceitalea sp.]|uniref:tetratricopeptide repeat-containing sensor histidine kinase n=1 Tax=uncultured Croceitalea sp. TaxID=1798908 RepID=UPI0033067A39
MRIENGNFFFFSEKLRASQKIVFLLIGFLLVAMPTAAQDEVRFQAFGRTPKVISDSLYTALRNAKSKANKSRTLFAIGQEHLIYGDTDSVIHYTQLLKTIDSSRATLPINTIRYQRLLGQGRLLGGLYNDALKAFIEGLELSQKAGKKTETAWLNLELGRVYGFKSELKKAKTLLSPLAKNNNDTIAAKATFYLASIAMFERDFNLTSTYLERASELIAQKELPKFKLQIQLILARLAFKKEDYDKAREIFEYVMQTALPNNYFDVYTEAVLGYGEISRLLKQYQVAEMSLAMAYTNSIQWSRLELQKKIINSLRLTYQEKGDYENAYNLMTQYVSISNQIIRQQNNRAIKELEIKYQTLQKENEIFELKEAQLEKQVEIERQKTIKKAFLFGFLALLIPIIALLFVYYQKLQAQSQLNLQQEQLNSQKIASLLNEQELALARTALDAQQEERLRIAKQLHDSIGGNLAGIKLQLNNLEDKKSFKKDLMAQVDETYELVREISHNLTPKKFNQNNFTLLVERYLSQLNNNSDLQINFSAHPEEKVNALSEKLKIEVYQIIQELLTNTIKHAKAKSLEVYLNIFDNTLQLIFEDDGLGFDTNKMSNGIGLKNMENRVQTLNGSMNLDSTLNRGTVVTLEIPLNQARREKA